MTLPKPRAILFDWDNTLVDTWPLIHAALNMTLRHMEHPEWSFDKVRNDVKKSMRDSFPELFGDRWEDAAQHYQDSYRSIHLQQLTPLPGAADMLAAIPSNIVVGLVSNKRGDSLRKEVKHLGWGDYVSAIVGSGDAARDKPDIAPVMLALARSPIAAGPSVWFVGDTGIDLECAQNTGCTPILFGEHVTERDSFEGFPFAHHVRNHKELHRLIATASQ